MGEYVLEQMVVSQNLPSASVPRLAPMTPACCITTWAAVRLCCLRPQHLGQRLCCLLAVVAPS